VRVRGEGTGRGEAEGRVDGYLLTKISVVDLKLLLCVAERIHNPGGLICHPGPLCHVISHLALQLDHSLLGVSPR
jgi:hypothetical protein